jgi:hypothetical protein
MCVGRCVMAALAAPAHMSQQRSTNAAVMRTLPGLTTNVHRFGARKQPPARHLVAVQARVAHMPPGKAGGRGGQGGEGGF